MTEILKSYKVRLYPNPVQAIRLNKTFGCVRVIWNQLVANFNSYGTDQYVEKFSEKVRNQRSYFIHNMTKALVEEFDLISVEDLNVAGMKKSNLGKSISDTGWSEFTRQLEYKSKWYGKTFFKIDRFYASSQICSSCGHKDGKKALDVREWTCSSCGESHDRDLNAATNILLKGYSDLTGLSINDSSAELVDHKRGEEVRLGDKLHHHLASSVKRLDKFIGLS